VGQVSNLRPIFNRPGRREVPFIGAALPTGNCDGWAA